MLDPCWSPVYNASHAYTLHTIQGRVILQWEISFPYAIRIAASHSAEYSHGFSAKLATAVISMSRRCGESPQSVRYESCAGRKYLPGIRHRPPSSPPFAFQGSARCSKVAAGSFSLKGQSHSSGSIYYLLTIAATLGSSNCA